MRARAGAASRTRTSDLPIRNRALCPTELTPQGGHGRPGSFEPRRWFTRPWSCEHQSSPKRRSRPCDGRSFEHLEPTLHGDPGTPGRRRPLHPACQAVLARLWSYSPNWRVTPRREGVGRPRAGERATGGPAYAGCPVASSEPDPSWSWSSCYEPCSGLVKQKSSARLSARGRVLRSRLSGCPELSASSLASGDALALRSHPGTDVAPRVARRRSGW